MSVLGFFFNKLCTVADRRRDRNLIFPENIIAHRDLRYIEGTDEYNLLDVYYPKTTYRNRPTIVIVHGGGYVYGTKKIYEYYGAYLAGQGFTVVNYNYHLAPSHRFPTQLIETNAVLQWMSDNADNYFIDTQNVFLTGDSAGAQLASHYAAIYSDPVYASRFPFSPPHGVKIRALALFCGVYDFPSPARLQKNGNANSSFNFKSLMRDYLGKNYDENSEMLQISSHIGGDFPPSFVVTSQYDFLKANAKPFYELLVGRGVPAQYKLYGEKGDRRIGHVFHVNMNLDEAKHCGDEQAAFFRKYIG